MNLTGIISISGKPGLYRVVAQGNNNVIVESLEDGKRFPAHSNNKISALDDISIYTYEEDVPLKDVFTSIYEKEKGGTAISHKESAAKLVEYMTKILPKYDQERVYSSDIKKLFQWYNLLHNANALVLEEEFFVFGAQQQFQFIAQTRMIRQRRVCIHNLKCRLARNINQVAVTP